jgi:hypothetical protein
LRLRCHSCIRRSMPRSLAVLRWSKGWSPEANREIDEHARLLLLSCLIMGIAAPGCSRAIKYREGSGTALGGVRTYKRIPYGGHPRPPRSRLPAILIVFSRSSGAPSPRYQCVCRGRYQLGRESTPRGRRQRPVMMARAPSRHHLIYELWVVAAVAGGVDLP